MKRVVSVLSNEQISKFVQIWFDQLSEHVPVEHLLPMVSPSNLEMIFPEKTIHSHAEFRDWYKQIGTVYTNQQHILEQLHTILESDSAELHLTVVWKAIQLVDRADIAARATQAWTLRTTPDGTPVIVRYKVLSLKPL